MSKTKLLGILVGVLGVLNIALIAFLLINKPGNRRPMGPPRDMRKSEDMIKKQFGFDEKQMELFRISKDAHQKNIMEVESELNNKSRAYYLDLNSEKGTDTILLNEINELSNKVYLINASHFKEVREICTEEQLPEMQNFIKLLLDKGPQPPKKDRR